MSLKIRRKTDYFKINDRGFFEVCNDVSITKTSVVWDEPVQKSLNLIRDILGTQVISVYLRGSTANNTQIKGVSDIDLIVITFKDISSIRKSFLQKELSLIKKDYDFFTKFDVMYIRIKDVSSSQYRALIKLTSRRIYGRNIKVLIPNLRPGTDIAVTLSTFESEVKELLLSKKFVSPRETCVWIMKRILRSGSELVSQRAGLYARDLYSCYKIFSDFYPKYKNKMYICLKMALLPSNDIEEIKKAVEDIAWYLISESKSYKIIKNNPKVGAVLNTYRVACASNCSIDERVTF